MSALPSFADSSRTFCEVREWDGPAALAMFLGWKSHADAPPPMPAAQPKNSPRLSAAFPPVPHVHKARLFEAVSFPVFRLGVEATDVASVSKVIHTDNQLHAGQFGKAAYTGWIRIRHC